MEHLRGNYSRYEDMEESNFMWVAIFASIAIGMLCLSYICKRRWQPVIIFEYTTRPELEMGTSTSINVDPRPLMLQVSSPRKRSSSPKDPAEMV